MKQPQSKVVGYLESSHRERTTSENELLTNLEVLIWILCRTLEIDAGSHSNAFVVQINDTKNSFAIAGIDHDRS